MNLNRLSPKTSKASAVTLAEILPVYQARVEAALDQWLPAAEVEPVTLHRAMRYASLGGGKRIRPVLLYACGQTFGVPLQALDGLAAAVEMIHAYSLIHDDLPAMDDDDLRRGKPTCHKAFDEATAILAGDAIQALSFHVIAHDPAIMVAADQRIRMIDTLAVTSGSLGMAGGQAIDLAAVGHRLTIAQLENMHNHKTGSLILASVQLGALSSSNLTQQQYDVITEFARHIGLAFQVQDDILDVEADTAVLGKPQGSDMLKNKPTYPGVLGMVAAKRAALELHAQAVQTLDGLDQDTQLLRQIADYIVQRNN
jgi:geranylgeranyl pyrophosphate synthase